MTDLQPPILSDRVRVKICGVTTPADARAAAAAGADAVGLVFVNASRRGLTIERAAEIADALPPFIARVALFMDHDARGIAETMQRVPIDVIQFHGRESPAFCRDFGRAYVKSVPMGEPGLRLTDWAERYHDAAALLLDANRAGQVGGQGTTFDWRAAIDQVGAPVVIAGGLNANNVGDAIARFSPYAVDVSSGVENAHGKKSRATMAAFIDAVKRADNL